MWRRVNRQHKCPICNHDSWCAVAADTGLVYCMRITSAEQRGEGWLHRPESIRGRKVERLPEPPPKRLTVSECVKLWTLQSSFSRPWIDQAARELGAGRRALLELGTGRLRPNVLSWPMRNAFGAPIGMRYRDSATGKKWAEPGSREGLFIPFDLLGIKALQAPLHIVEGPTDTAALLTVGLYAIGRPSAKGGKAMLAKLINWLRPPLAVLWADADQPLERNGKLYTPVGLAGAVALQGLLECPTVIAHCPDAKDVRAWLQQGATKADFLEACGCGSNSVTTCATRAN